MDLDPSVVHLFPTSAKTGKERRLTLPGESRGEKGRRRDQRRTRAPTPQKRAQRPITVKRRFLTGRNTPTTLRRLPPNANPNLLPHADRGGAKASHRSRGGGAGWRPAWRSASRSRTGAGFWRWSPSRLRCSSRGALGWRLAGRHQGQCTPPLFRRVAGSPSRAVFCLLGPVSLRLGLHLPDERSTTTMVSLMGYCREHQYLNLVHRWTIPGYCETTLGERRTASMGESDDVYAGNRRQIASTASEKRTGRCFPAM
jgi:hypothetical protein